MINALWSMATRRDATAFDRGAPIAREVQERRLLSLVARNRETAFGRDHNFSGVRSLDDFRARVPMRTYEDFTPWVDRIAGGEGGVLTTERVLLFEPTGGTHGGTKLIPYTRSLRGEIRRAVAPWIRDVFRRHPEARWGRGYWSISPINRDAARTRGGTPIGFDDDAGYLGHAGAIIARTFVAPPALRFIRNVENFLYLAASCVLRAADLAIVSVWNPTMLTLLTDAIDRHVEGMVRDIRNGKVTLPVDGEAVPSSRAFRRDPARAAAIESAMSLPSDRRYAHVWPNLLLVSCWADGAARAHLPRVEKLFPDVHIQPKGLVATEGVITIPLGPDDAQVPAFTAHFLEFVPVEGGEAHCIDELENLREYSVAVTTGGGLYRYLLKDRVRVEGFYMGLPSLRFVGREATCDIVGEKLDEVHVRRVLERAFAEESVSPGFAMMTPEPSDRGGHYVMFVELNSSCDDVTAERIRRLVEEGLGENFQYRHAREIGQLDPLQLYRVGSGASSAYVGRCLDDGQRLGDVKPVYLDRRSGWGAALSGRRVDGTNHAGVSS
jgi:hypothetical protein